MGLSNRIAKVEFYLVGLIPKQLAQVVAMPKTTDLECDWCGSLWVGANNPKEFWRSVCPKPGSCTARIVSRYFPDEPASACSQLPIDAAPLPLAR